MTLLLDRRRSSGLLALGAVHRGGTSHQYEHACSSEQPPKGCSTKGENENSMYSYYLSAACSLCFIFFFFWLFLLVQDTHLMPAT